MKDVNVYGAGPDRKGPHDWTWVGPKRGFCGEALALYSFPMRKAMAEGKRGWEPSTHLDLGRRRMRREHPIKS